MKVAINMHYKEGGCFRIFVMCTLTSCYGCKHLTQAEQFLPFIVYTLQCILYCVYCTCTTDGSR